MYGVTGCVGCQLGSVSLRYQRVFPQERRGYIHSSGGFRQWVWRLGAEVDSEETVGEARTPEMARLEAVLLLAREPMGSRRLADLTGLADGTAARTLVQKLRRRYDEEGCAFQVVEVAGGFQLMSRPKFAPWLRRLHSSLIEVRLSAPAMETLAVVAYRQPLMRADIEAVRGVQCGEILRQLMERELVRIVGRAEELGRPFLYGTTKRFLQVFGLRHLDELPRPAGFEPQATSPLKSAATPDENQSEREPSNQPIHSTKEGELNVKTAAHTRVVPLDPTQEFEEQAVTLLDPEPGLVRDAKDEDFDDEDEDLEDDEDEDEDEDLEEEDLEEEEWEEVDDEELDEEDELEEDEDEWDDDDWDDDDDDWEEDEEDDDDWE